MKPSSSQRNFLFATSILCVAFIAISNTATATANNNINTNINNNNNVNLPPTTPLLAGGLLSSLTSPLFIETNKLYHQLQANNTTANINHPPTGALSSDSNSSNKTVNQLLKQLQLKATNQRGGPQQLNILSSSPHQQPQGVKPTVKLTGQPAAANLSLNAVRKRWRQMELSMGDSLGTMGLKLKLALDELTGNQRSAASSVSPGCKSAINELAEGLASHKLWASKTVDASARLPSGLLEGTLTELGHFDQCLGLSYQSPPPPPETHNQRQSMLTTTGQYCSIQIKPPLIPRARLHTICQKLPTLATGGAGSGVNGSQTLGQLLSQNSQHFYYAGLRLGICTPSRCHKTDVQLLLTAYLAKFDLLGQVKSCQVLGEERGGAGSVGEFKLDSVQQSIVLALVCLVSLVALGTIVDLASSKPICKGETGSQRTWTMGGCSHQPVSTDSASSSSGSDQHLGGGGGSSGGDRMAPNGKRWLYQVYRSPLGVCQLHQSPAALSSSSPGLQKNPLAAMDQPTGGDLANGLESHILLGGQFSALHSPSRQEFDECHLDSIHGNGNGNGIHGTGMEQEVDGGGGDDDEEEEEEVEVMGEEEAWIAQLERNQAKLNDFAASNASGVGNKAQRRKQLPSKPRLGIRTFMKEFVVCFSLRTNLRLIGRHVANADVADRKPGKCKSMLEHHHCLSSKQAYKIRDKAGTATKLPSSPPPQNELADIKVIHGLRTITMIWIIFGHTIGLVNPEMMNNLFAVAQLSCSSRLLQALLNATLAVNTFFMISGLVTVVSLVRRCGSANRLLGGNSTTSRATCGSGSATAAAAHHMVSKEDDLESSSVGSLSSLGSSMGSSNRCISGGAASSAGGQQRQNRKRHQAGRKTMGGRKQPASSRSRSRSMSSGGQRRRTAAASAVANNRSIGWPSDFQPLAWLAMRYLRLTPAYAATIGLSILMPIMGSGPFWQESAGQLGPVCRENWWLNLIYANNFINTDKLCLIHSWYLSNDWQFFLVTIVLLTVGYKSLKLALLLFASLLFGSSAATYALTVANDFPPTIVSTSPAVAERWLFIHSLYYKPWPHLPSYLIGLLTGYMLLVKDRIKLSRSTRIGAWIIFTALALALLNSIYPWNMGLQVEPHLTGLHSSTFRTLWATCCAWLVFGLATRPHSALAKLLGWHGFQVSSRLTYCVYLVHPLIIYYHFGTLRERMDSSVYGQLHRFIATLGLSYLFALILSLTVESPSIQLQRLVLATFGGSSSGSGASNGGPGASPSGLGRDRNCSTCSGATNDSWIGTSSFGEQSSGSGSNLALVGDQSYHHHQSNNNNRSKMMSSGILPQHTQPNKYLPNGYNGDLANQMGFQQQQQHQMAPSAWTSTMHNSDTSGTPAMDVDFQRKLAQAIGRGFRIRSKLANGPIRPPSLQPLQQQSVTAEGGQVTRQDSGVAGIGTQVKRRLSTGVALPAPAMEKKAASNDKIPSHQDVAMAAGQQQQQQQLHNRSTAIRPSNFQQVDHKSPKKVEFSTFFLGQTTNGPNNLNGVDQSQQIAIAAANYQKRRLQELNLMARQQNHIHQQVVAPPPPINGIFKQQQQQQLHQQQQQVAELNNMMHMKRHEPAAAAALLTRSQNQLDQFNPRDGSERV